MTNSAMKIIEGKEYYIKVKAFQYHVDTVVIEYKSVTGNKIISEVDPTDLIEAEKFKCEQNSTG